MNPRPVEHSSDRTDVLIVGGSIAGLSAALLLGRCRRKVAICDTGRRQNCDLAQKLGCELNEGFVICSNDSKTCVPGLFAAGNTSSGLQLAIVAAAEGAKAAPSINTMLGVKPFLAWNFARRMEDFIL